ncbi:Dopey protein [Dictyocaulus viviparus]|uniref:Dopey protein n=1 Tax=Dictyocaulus viviparus TaxID=29172 RepID=A0A0D8YBA1_DICVI|nr:Dopey protein [Dictyocaulus viviparus]
MLLKKRRNVKRNFQISHMSSSSGGYALGDVTVPNPLHNTSKYKVYVQAVERALKTFENPNEWADLISALAKLTKVFQSNAKFGDIPKPVTVAKRLSQCLHPALPMGVHLKALETYRQIFDILGPQSLPKLLYLFAVGLFPLMDHCGIKVKSELFNIFEQYLLPLGQNLRPALPGFLAGVLLGLEEGTEFYERSLSVLDQVCEGVGERAFFACLWQAVLDSPSVRLPAMLYVNAKFDKSRSLDDQIAIVGDHVNHMVAALCATANDSGSPLVQRNLLDFLSAAFPLDSKNLTREDFVQLVMRCVFVVLRRDMSLNRRLYTWLMNPTGGNVAITGIPIGDDKVESTFFTDKALPLIVDALTQYLKLDVIEIPQSSTNAWVHGWGDKRESEQHQFAEVRVCRLLLYLQDRADIGVPVLNNVFPLFLKCVSNVYERLTKDFFCEKKKHSECDFDRNKLRLSVDSKQSCSSSVVNVGLEPDKTKDQKRRLDEISKTFNLLLNSLEQGFLFEFLGSWFTEILDIPGPNSSDISQFSKVVIFCLETCNLDGNPVLRAQALPKLLRRILSILHCDAKLLLVECSSLLQVIEVCSKLLSEISQVCAVDANGSNEEVSDTSCAGTPIKHAQTSVISGAIGEDQVLMESCVMECLMLLSSVSRLYCTTRSSGHLPLLTAICSLVSQFVDYPLYCVTIEHQSNSQLPNWLDEALKVVDPDSWVHMMSETSLTGNVCDLSARITAFDLILSIYLKCASVLSQHEAISGRLSERCNKSSEGSEDLHSTTVLLKPLLFGAQLNQLEKERIFERCGQAIWIGVGSSWCAQEHEKLSRLMALLHSRKPNEASSDVENIVVSALASSDTMTSTEAAQTFHRMWMLTRACDDNTVFPMKPFNRAVMLLLGVLADESVSRSRVELKSVAAAWFIDCAKHNDLPRIVQMLATMLMNPVTARISIQYVWQEARLSKEQFPSMPQDVSVVTLVTHDGKQRLYHFDGPVTDGAWQYELRNRLLLSCETSTAEVEPSALSTCVAVPGDIPNFDDDTDSLDTLSMSMDGADMNVVETVQYMIECVVEEEESELDNRQRLESAPNFDKIIFDMGFLSNVPRSDDGLEAVPSAVSVGLAHENDKQPSALVSEAISSSYKFKKGHRRQDSLQESIFSMTEKELKTFDTTELLRTSIESSSEGVNLFHESHVHMLLYGESGRVVDLGRSETAFRILTALLCPRGSPVSNRLLLNCLVSSGTASQNGDFSGVNSFLTVSLVDLMAKHVRAILGQHFWSTTGEEDMSKHRHLTLSYIYTKISYMINLQIAALDFLSELLGELCGMVCEQQSRQFVMFVQSLLSRSKLQRCLLHLLLTTVHDPRTVAEPGQIMPLSVSIFEFNEGRSSSAGKLLTGLLSAYNRSLLSVTAQAIRLESDIKNGFSNFGDINPSGVINRLTVAQQLYNTPSHRGTLREPSPALVELRAFLLIVLNALKARPERHEMWFQFVVQILPWMERSLATVVVRVVEQLCKNVETAMSVCFANVDSELAVSRLKETENNYPACFITMTLETITTLIHFCIVDAHADGSAIQTTTPMVTGSGGSMVGQAIAVIPGTKGATELFSNLVKVFSFSDSTSSGGTNLSKLEGTRGSIALKQARNDMLTSLPHALATICDIWMAVRNNTMSYLPLGSPQQYRRLVLDLLSPIAQHHQQAFLTALSLVWLTRSGNCSTSHRKTDPDQLIFHYTEAQHDIANLLLSIKVLSFEELVSAISDTLKEVGVKVTKLGVGEKATFPTEAPLLEMVHCCVKALPTGQLRTCWSHFQSLFADAPLSSLPPRAVFLLYIILCDYVRCAGASYIIEDKTMSRAVQDAVQRLTEAVNTIVGWQLETTTWLKRTLVVKHDQGPRSQDISPSVEMNTPLNTPLPSMNQSEQSSMRGSTLSLMTRHVPSSLDAGTSAGPLTEKKSSSNLRASVKDSNNNKRDPAHSTQALFLLAENLAELVDSVCKSDDKERLLPTLHAVWGNVVPYLRAKNINFFCISARNSRFFLASSQLLASMSSFSYMRPIWKKTTLELLLDSSFFKMDMHSLKQWLIVSDHLMTHDKTSFKDLLKSIAYTPNASFSIMTSKEQEYEARALAVKRLAFVVLGSELDQYQAQMNDIQERLSENLRVSQSPSIRSAVFLCIRVLLLRLRPPGLIGIWPIMITELVHVLLQMEQQLCSEGNGIEDLGCARDDAWMQLYLAACKLLETLCTLPAGYLAQFQMCQWAFVNSVSTSKTDIFLPFAGRINKLLRTKFGKLTSDELANLSPSLCGMKILTSFEELRPFFYALSTQNMALPVLNEGSCGSSSFLAGSLSYKSAVERLEHALCVDFAEHWQL